MLSSPRTAGGRCVHAPGSETVGGEGAWQAAGRGSARMTRKMVLAACAAAAAASHAAAFQPCATAPASALRAQRGAALRPSTRPVCAAGGRLRPPALRAERRSAAARYPGAWAVGCVRGRVLRGRRAERPPCGLTGRACLLRQSEHGGRLQVDGGGGRARCHHRDAGGHVCGL